MTDVTKLDTGEPIQIHERLDNAPERRFEAVAIIKGLSREPDHHGVGATPEAAIKTLKQYVADRRRQLAA